ncbi:MAG: VanW family protein [Deltaproteobacteria bacterium]|nr:VanW family protein [Deltaproteobacteria bacterium]
MRKFIGLTISLVILILALSYGYRPYRETLGAFTTQVVSRTPAQIHNIQLAAQNLHGLVLNSQEQFSLNQLLGNNFDEQGYVAERAYLEGQVVQEVGGGICQLASTLYNAALISGLKVLERSGHSLPVQSVPSSLDATFKLGAQDLRIQNPYPFPIKVEAYVRGHQLTVRWLGSKSSTIQTLHRQIGPGHYSSLLVLEDHERVNTRSYDFFEKGVPHGSTY